MKYLRLTGSPDLAAVPDLVRVLAASPHAEEARLLNWHLGGTHRGATVTMLFAVDGDRAAMVDALRETPAVARVDAAALSADRCYLLVDVRTDEAPMLREVLVETLTQPGLAVLPPVVYRDGGVDARFVGRSGAVQAAVEGLPDPVSVTVEAVTEGGVAPGRPADALSDRQREAVEAALALGYYDQPRGGTHEDVAAALDCAPSTASEHLRKAEAKLVRTALGGPHRPPR